MSRAAALLAVLALTPAASAGLYSPDEKCPFHVRPDGTAEELSYDENGFGQYKLAMGRLADVGNPRAKRTNPTVQTAREQILDRISRLKADPATQRDPAKLAGLAADLIRTRQADAALNVLAPRSRDRVPDFRVLANLAHVHAVRGEWAEAVRAHAAARLDAVFPPDLAGATPEQRKWLQRVETEFYPRWLRVHKQEADRRTPPADEEPFPLFDGPPPADAIAVIQQLLLWHPDDVRLHWLLADRYAASGRLRQAERIFDELAEGRQQSNRKHLMDQRAAVKKAVAALPPPAAAEDVALPASADAPAPKKAETLADLGLTTEKLTVVGVVAGVVVVGLLLLQVRALRRGMTK